MKLLLKMMIQFLLLRKIAIAYAEPIWTPFKFVLRFANLLKIDLFLYLRARNISTLKQTIFNPALKETIVFTKTSQETNGQYSELQISLEPGGGNPMHYHRSYTELFTAIEGRLGLELKGGQQIILNPGASYLVKINEAHRFFNPDRERITFSNKVEPGSTGLENTLRILARLANDGLYTSKNIPKNLYHMAVCGALSDMRLTGIAGLITSPIVATLARLARKNGIEKQLIDHYCK